MKNLTEELKIITIEQSYVCAELGYTYSLGNKSMKELFDKLGNIIGKRKEN